MSEIETIIDEYIEGYEVRGDNGDYTPTDQERFLIKDCIMGLIEEKKFLALLQSDLAELTQYREMWEGLEVKEECQITKVRYPVDNPCRCTPYPEGCKGKGREGRLRKKGE